MTTALIIAILLGVCAVMLPTEIRTRKISRRVNKMTERQTVDGLWR